MGEIDYKGSPFIGNKVKLRPLELSDLDRWMQITNNYDTKVYASNFLLYSRKQIEDWIVSLKEEANKRSKYTFAIETLGDQRVVGSIGVRYLDWVNRHGNIGVMIHHPDDVNKGYGSEAILLLMRFCFDILNLHRLELFVVEYNARAIHVYSKLGFKESARQRQRTYIEGNYYDNFIMDILEDEFRDRQEKGGNA
ncbi:MAG: GNAT family N-acetyltransferase [Candidatus Hodarchaeota archaeon]